jgi:hypothetical protein
LPENIFILGLIPPPYIPDFYSIIHILTPLVSTFSNFWSPGKIIPTYSHPGGTIVQSCIHSVLADLQAI